MNRTEGFQQIIERYTTSNGLTEIKLYTSLNDPPFTTIYFSVHLIFLRCRVSIDPLQSFTIALHSTLLVVRGSKPCARLCMPSPFRWC